MLTLNALCCANSNVCAVDSATTVSSPSPAAELALSAEFECVLCHILAQRPLTKNALELLATVTRCCDAAVLERVFTTPRLARLAGFYDGFHEKKHHELFFQALGQLVEASSTLRDRVCEAKILERCLAHAAPVVDGNNSSASDKDRYFQTCLLASQLALSAGTFLSRLLRIADDKPAMARRQFDAGAVRLYTRALSVVAQGHGSAAGIGCALAGLQQLIEQGDTEPDPRGARAAESAPPPRNAFAGAFLTSGGREMLETLHRAPRIKEGASEELESLRALLIKMAVIRSKRPQGVQPRVKAT